jgi:hypothetical protein
MTDFITDQTKERDFMTDQTKETDFMTDQTKERHTVPVNNL